MQREKDKRTKKGNEGTAKVLMGRFYVLFTRGGGDRRGGEKVMVYRNFRLGSLGVCNFFLGGVVFFLLLGVL